MKLHIELKSNYIGETDDLANLERVVIEHKYEERIT